MVSIKNTSKSSGSKKVSLRDEIGKFLKYWPWFLICVMVTVGAGYTYLRYTTPIYSASATIIINEENANGSGSEMSAYENLGFISGLSTNSLEKELAILRSRRLMKDVVKTLNIHIRYFMEGNIREIEVYKNHPFNLKVLKFDDDKLKSLGGAKYAFRPIKDSYFSVRNLKNEKSFIAKAGVPFSLDFAEVVLVTNSNFKELPEITIKFSNIEKEAIKYRNKVQLIQGGKSSNVIELALQDPVKQKAKEIIDQLIYEFNRDAIDDKNLIARNTASFINDRLDIINAELESVETGKEEFKEDNRLTDINAESQMFIQNASEYNRKLQEVGTQMELSQAVLEYISSSSGSDLLPANLGIQEGGINQQINEYNDLILERNRILVSSTNENPVVVRLNNTLRQIKGNIVQGLQGMRTNLQISQGEMKRQAYSIGSRIMAVPSQEREYRGIERQQNIKEALYLFLLQKREENSLALAITAPKAKIVDQAYSAGNRIYPVPRNILLGSIILGLFVPFSIIYLKDILDNKVRNRKDLELLESTIPFVGEIPKVRAKEHFTIQQNDRSVLAESFRILVTNMQFLLSKAAHKDKGAVIFVTSTIKGEGKTFTSINLGITYANKGKKVLILGGDLRSPKLQPFKPKDSQKLGVSDYISNEKLDLQDLIGNSIFSEHLDILSSGSIPPNPSELLGSKRMEVLISEIQLKYDYIIVDTAPAMLVADTFSLNKYADVILYVVRAGFTNKNLIEFVSDANEAGTLDNLGFVLNNVDITNLGYGNKYGYGYGDGNKKNIKIKS